MDDARIDAMPTDEDGGSPEPDASTRLDAEAAPDASAADVGAISDDPWALGPSFGARLHPSGDLEVRVRAPRATRLELGLFSRPRGEPERLRVAMQKSGDHWSIVLPADRLTSAQLGTPIYYGLRAFGPNWTFDPAWAPGSELGFVADVDGDGHRMNPNKLLLDPYALEISHDPTHPEVGDRGAFNSGPDQRRQDTGPVAPKAVVIPVSPRAAPGPERPFKDEIIYEVHLRGFTRGDDTVPEAERGTYAGAIRRARYLRDLGVTAIELLPLQETHNDQNESTADAAGDNYWGYAPLGFFAPDRRYAADGRPGGATLELRAMIEAFHAEGLKVYVDVVYNHTAEPGGGGDRTGIWSFRGLDNPGYYELARDRAQYVNNNGVGPNLNVADPVTADLVIDSLRYWHEILGADGFRFDLASVLGNRCTAECFEFRRDGLLTRISEALPARAGSGGPGADLIAEPWGLGADTYQIGQFPAGWSEWNDHFRDSVRRDLNRLDVDEVTPRELGRRLAGSPDLFGDDGRAPAASIGYVVSHDGMTLHDLFSYAGPSNDLAWPCGPSGGGSTNELSWDHRGDAGAQRRAARTALGLLGLSAGVPMIVGGDEMLRTQSGNNNAYNIDSSCTWLDWSRVESQASFHRFSSRLFAFRNAHPALRPGDYWGDRDLDGDGQRTATWIMDDGEPAGGAYLDDPSRHFVGLLLDGDELGDPSTALYLAYNGWSEALNARLPLPPSASAWRLIADTGIEAETWDNFHEQTLAPPTEGETHRLEPRSLALWFAP